MKTTLTNRAALIGTAVIAIAQTVPVLAQSESSAPAGRRAAALDEVVVTAQRRAQPLQEVPLSVAAISEEELESRNIEVFEDYARSVPSLSFDNTNGGTRGQFLPVIRGVGLGAGPGAAPTTAFLIDETPLQPSEFERTGVPDPNMFDVNRVEILRGPQGTVYGASSMGGTIKLIYNRPDTSDFYSRAETSFSAINDGGEDLVLNGMVNLPLTSEKLALRMSALTADYGGWIDQVPYELIAAGLSPQELARSPSKTNANESEVDAFRAALLWNASDQFTLTPSLMWQRIEEEGNQYSSYSLSSQLAEPVYIDFGSRGDEPSEREYVLANLLLEVGLDRGELISSTTYYEIDWKLRFGATGLNNLLTGEVIPSTVNDIGTEEIFTQELRYTSQLDGPLNFIIGGFYRDVSQKLSQTYIVPEFEPIFGTADVFVKPLEEEDLKEKAVFLSLNYRPVDSFEAEAGVRWFEYERSQFTDTVDGILGIPVRRNSAKEDDINPSASVTYFFSDAAMTYARAAKGYRPGFGLSTIFPPQCADELIEIGLDPTAPPGQVDADYLWSYEIGGKTSWLSNRLTVNFAAYQTDWKNVQLDLALDCGFNFTTNAGAIEVSGAEFEVQAQPTEALHLSFGVGYTDAAFDVDDPRFGVQQGDPLPRVPEWTGAASVDYSFPLMGELSDSRRSYLRFDYTYTGSSHHSTDFANELDDKPALSLLHFRFGVDYDDWSVALFAKNLLDDVEFNQCGPDGLFRLPAPDFATCYNRPREFGVTVSVGFGR